METSRGDAAAAAWKFSRDRRAPQVPADPRGASFINSDTNLNSSSLLDELAAIVDDGALTMQIDSTYSLEDIAAAFDKSAAGHVVGKVSVVVNATTCAV